MPLDNKECCCAPSIDTECWTGARISTGANCVHTTTERLEYRCARPASAGRHDLIPLIQNPGDPISCPCIGTFTVAQVACLASPDLVVRYNHFDHLDMSRLRVWWYQRAYEVWPPCSSGCCGDNGDAGCCNDTDTTNCVDWYDYDGEKMSSHQKTLVEDGFASPKNTSEGGFDPDPCEYGDTYKFLDGVADYILPGSIPANEGKRFNHYHMDIDGLMHVTPTRKLAQTMVAVFHLQKWYERDYNNLRQDHNAAATSTDHAASSARTPPHFVYACVGIPVYSWEVMELSSLTDTQKETFFQLTSGYGVEGSPEQPFASVDAAAILDTLVADGILASPRDWGAEAGDKPIKKTLNFFDVDDPDVFETETRFFYGRSGGWTYCCNHASQAGECVGNEPYFDQYWPQVNFRVNREECATNCYPPDEPGLDCTCLTSAPTPGLDCRCRPIGGVGNPTGCGLSNVPCGDLPAGCTYGNIATCSGDVSTYCAGEVLIGNCFGMRGHNWSYELDQPYGLWINPYSCGSNFADLWRYDASLEPDNKNDRSLTEDEVDDILPLRSDLTHLIPRVVSGRVVAGESPQPSLCCGGKGSFDFGGDNTPEACPTSQPRGDVCVD